MATESVPMSMPAILMGPKAAVPAHLHQPARKKKPTSSGGRPEPVKRWEGRKWTRRRENDLLFGNPHIVAPTRSDASAVPQPNPSTFPSPLPPTLLPRTRPAPSPAPPESDPLSAQAGTFTLSLKGIRKSLRGRGVRPEQLVRIVERELDDWEDESRRTVVRLSSAAGGRGGSTGGSSGRVIDDYLVPAGSLSTSTTSRESLGNGGVVGERALPIGVAPIGGLSNLDMLSRNFEKDGLVPAIVELARNPGSLTWAIAEGFERFIVHAISRYRNLVSFSKTTPQGTRLTYILRRVNPHRHMSSLVSPSGPNPLSTPPTTDMSSAVDSSSDWGGHWDDSASEAGSAIEGLPAREWESDIAEGDEEEEEEEAHAARTLLADEVLPSRGLPSVAEGESDDNLVGGHEEDSSDDDDEESNAGSIALLSLSSSVASLDLDPIDNDGEETNNPAAPSTPSRRPAIPSTSSVQSSTSRTPIPNITPRSGTTTLLGAVINQDDTFTVAVAAASGQSTPTRTKVTAAAAPLPGPGELSSASTSRAKARNGGDGGARRVSFLEYLGYESGASR